MGLLMRIGLFVGAVFYSCTQIGVAHALDSLPTDIDSAAFASDDALAVMMDDVLREITNKPDDGGRPICVALSPDIRIALNIQDAKRPRSALVQVIQSQLYAHGVKFAPDCDHFSVLMQVSALESIDSAFCQKAHCAEICVGAECKRLFLARADSAELNNEDFVAKVNIFRETGHQRTTKFRISIANGRLGKVLRHPEDSYWGF
jgi:hypothetical protein